MKSQQPEIEISIVTGTYNRIKHLQNMVNSARQSIGIGVHYEIVVVDGGSNDGSIEWCEEQIDIVLVKQGKLLGAVRAFNEGARIARGRYVVLANDDITFVGLSILNALTFMHDNPLVGIGCFAQDRGGQNWHVSAMSAIVDGKPSTTYYGQVCIVPKWLGDYVGWWGDYLYTYGGDNELSCNVLELGYKTLPAPCAFIHDITLPADALRDANNKKIMKNGKHPDTEAWLKKWTRKGVLGPVVKDHPDDPVVLKRPTRIFYMPIYEPGNKMQKITKHGLRDALAKIGIVVECDYLSVQEEDVLELACAIDADIFVTQFHGSDQTQLVDRLRNQHPHAIFVNWNGDYHPEYLLSSGYIDFLKRFDYVGVVTTVVKERYDAAKINWFYWQIGYEDVSDKLPKVQMHDVVFLANGYSKERLELATKLRGMKTANVGIYGAWPQTIRPNGNTLYDFDTGHALYKNCKIAIGDSQWPRATGFVSNRLFQAMYAGAFLLHQYFDGMEELLGLKNGVHLVTWLSWTDLQEKIKYYLKCPAERQKIAETGRKFVTQNHSFDVRVKELLEKIHE